MHAQYEWIINFEVAKLTYFMLPIRVMNDDGWIIIHPVHWGIN